MSDRDYLKIPREIITHNPDGLYVEIVYKELKPVERYDLRKD